MRVCDTSIFFGGLVTRHQNYGEYYTSTVHDYIND